MKILSMRADLIQEILDMLISRPISRDYIIHLYTYRNSFSSQQNHVILWVDMVLYYWLDRILTQSSIYYSYL